MSMKTTGSDKERSRSLTELLNEIYEKEDSRLDPELLAMAVASLPPEDEEW